MDLHLASKLPIPLILKYLPIQPANSPPRPMIPSSQGDPCVPTSKSPPPAPNGAKSRGPVTSRGKQNSSRNGIRHGAFARAHPIAPQFKEFFQARLVGFTAEFRPNTENARDLVRLAALLLTRFHQLGAATLRPGTVHSSANSPCIPKPTPKRSSPRPSPPYTAPPAVGSKSPNASTRWPTNSAASSEPSAG